MNRQWIAKAAACIVGLTLAGASAAQELFANCTTSLQDAAYQPLAKFLAASGGRAELCQALGGEQFVFSSGRDFYFCAFRQGGACSEIDPSARYPGMDVMQRFSGPDGKTFALVQTGGLAGGVYGSSLHATASLKSRDQ